MSRWQREPALTERERLILVEKARQVRQNIPRNHGRERELDALARAYGVCLRTLYRYERRAA